MKTLKQEEIYCNRYGSMEELAAHLEEFIDNYYNPLRLHSALGYRTREEAEQDAPPAADGATMTFFAQPAPATERGIPDS